MILPSAAMPAKGARIINAEKYALQFFATLLIFSLAIPIVQYHVSAFGFMGVGGLFINDSLGMQGSIKSFVDGVDGNYRTIIGVILLYYPSYYFGGPYCWLVNISLLSFSTLFFLKTISALQIRISAAKLHVMFLFIIGNFYLIAAFLHPNKEIPLLLLTNAFIYYSIAERKTLSVLFIIFLTFLVRDGHAIILLFTFVSFRWFGSVFSKHPYLVLISAFLILAAVPLEGVARLNIFGDYNYVLERNIRYGDRLESVLNALPSYIAYPLKVINNASSAALRPQLYDLNGRLYFHGVGLWQFGIIILLGLLSWFYILGRSYRGDERFRLLGMATFICLLFVSFGSFTQARYMAPYLYWLTAGFVLILSLDKIIIATFGVLMLTMFFSYFGWGVPLGFGIDVYPL